MTFGVLSDWCIKKKFVGLTASRKLYTTLSFTFPGIFLVAASFGGCNRYLAVALFTIAMGFMGAYYSGECGSFQLNFINKFYFHLFRNENQCVGFVTELCWYAL